MKWSTVTPKSTVKSTPQFLESNDELGKNSGRELVTFPFTSKIHQRDDGMGCGRAKFHFLLAKVYHNSLKKMMSLDKSQEKSWLLFHLHQKSTKEMMKWSTVAPESTRQKYTTIPWKKWWAWKKVRKRVSYLSIYVKNPPKRWWNGPRSRLNPLSKVHHNS